MTKFQAGVRYEMKKLLRALCLFVAGMAAALGALWLISWAGWFGIVSFGNLYSFVLLFLAFWLPIAFGRDAGLFLQSGLTRRQAFAIFALVAVVESLAFAIADGALSLATPLFWRWQSPVLGPTGVYTGALFAQVLLLNLTVAFSGLAVAALQKRVGTRWTVAIALSLFTVVFAGLPALFSLFPGGTEAFAAFVLSVASSPDAPEGTDALRVIFFAVAPVVATAITWALVRRTEAR